MRASLDFISGIMLGIEFVEDPDYEANYIVLDLFIIRFVFEWSTEK